MTLAPRSLKLPVGMSHSHLSSAGASCRVRGISGVQPSPMLMRSAAGAAGRGHSAIGCASLCRCPLDQCRAAESAAAERDRLRTSAVYPEERSRPCEGRGRRGPGVPPAITAGPRSSGLHPSNRLKKAAGQRDVLPKVEHLGAVSRVVMHHERRRDAPSRQDAAPSSERGSRSGATNPRPIPPAPQRNTRPGNRHAEMREGRDGRVGSHHLAPAAVDKHRAKRESCPPAR